MKNIDKLKFLETAQDQIINQVLQGQLVLNRNDEIALLKALKDQDKGFAPIQFSVFSNFLSAKSALFSRLAVTYKGKQLTRLVPNFVEVSVYDIALSLTLNKRAYFSCLSALYLNQLTVLNPTDLYLNFEQSEKPRDPNNAILTQAKADYGFRRPARTTNNTAEFTYRGTDYRLSFLNGQHTNYLGIGQIALHDAKQTAFIANLERSLIEAMIHPEYCGGVGNVLEAFIMAKDLISITKILDYLSQINYVYPYEQALLFYIQRAGYPQQHLHTVRQAIEVRHLNQIKFYLQHQMINPILDQQSQVYFPQAMQENE
ncbi:hypothetical protein [Oenococcus sicerae]|uniref:AbiEi antitoxin C-terminal domain-containing protein n=1 Tax=Oenococcus sicerae TaxID=2203724 RepID=A0AAJ1RCX8_9LACO|nr:hypothetical protein [Oenococcus sicerae]MDN6900675.1 hypothetical protein [Oenococcus sicerae]